MTERPSQQKVVGVSDRFLAYSERQMTTTADWIRFNEEELDLLEASRIGYMLGLRVMRNIFEMPLQQRRAQFLEYAREVEGKKPGEETIALYALAHCKRLNRYPMTQKQSQNPLH